MKDNYMHRKGDRQRSFMTMVSQYPKVHGIKHFLIVEGDSDEKFFQQIVDCEIWKISNLDGKENVLSYIKKNKLKNKQYVAVVDADFEHITGVKSECDNVFITDCHDIEMMIFSSNPDMQKIYSEYADVILINEYEKSNYKSFIDSVFEAAYKIGLFKLVNEKYKYGISFKDFQYELVVDKYFNVDLDSMINRLKERNSFDKIKESIESENQKNYDCYQVICGHDVTYLLAKSFVDFGYGSRKFLDGDAIESSLRMIYDKEHFKSTNLCKAFKKWETQNEIRILKQ